MEKLPQTLVYLNCINNDIEYIDQIPINLRYIYVDNNPLIIAIQTENDIINKETIEQYNTEIKEYLEYSYGRLK